MGGPRRVEECRRPSACVLLLAFWFVSFAYCSNKDHTSVPRDVLYRLKSSCKCEPDKQYLQPWFP